MIPFGRKGRRTADAGSLVEWLLDKEHEVVYRLGPDRRFRAVKGACARLWGYRAEDLVGLDFADLVDPRERRKVVAAFEEHLKGRHPEAQESQFLKRDGSAIRLVWTLADPLQDGTLYGEAREFRVRRPKRSPAWGAVDAETLLRALDEHTILSLADAEGRILSVNHRFCEISGYGLEELVGKDYRRVNSGFHGPLFFQDLWRTIRTGRPWKGEIRNRARSGALYWAATTILPVPGPSGAPSLYIAVQTDTTSLHQAEESLRQAHHMEALRAFAGGAAHDFTNLVASIQGACATGGRGSQPRGPVREAFERIEAAASRGSELANQLLAYLGPAPASPGRVDLNARLEECRSFLLAMVPRSTRLDLELDPGMPAVLADPGQVFRMVRILASNAFDAVNPAAGGWVVLKTGGEVLDRPFASSAVPGLTAPPGAYGTLEVRDNGEGMSPEVLRRAFDPFFTTKGHGRGLGLAALAEMVRNLQGSIQVASEQGRGTSVKVILPRL